MRRTTKQKSKLFLPLFIIGIMVLSMFGVVIGGLSDDSTTIKYNDIVFRQDSGTYLFTINDITYRTRYDPTTVEGFIDHLSPSFLQDFLATPTLYLDVSNQATVVYMQELAFNLNRERTIHFSCTEAAADEEHCLELPLYSCDTLPENTLLFTYALAGERSTTYENNCFALEGTESYLLGVTDALIMYHGGIFS